MSTTIKNRPLVIFADRSLAWRGRPKQSMFDYFEWLMTYIVTLAKATCINV